MGGELCARKSWKKMKAGLNETIAHSKFGKFFKLEARESCFTRELRAGTATFLTMAYIITVNATILSASGGTCSMSDCSVPINQTATPECMIKPNAGYEMCVKKMKSDFIVATIFASMIGSFSMGLFANLPFGLAPAMGSNAYLAFNLVGFHGSGPLSYQTAMAIVLVEGCAFLAISVFGVRAKLARLIPHPVRLATAIGIGLFIAFVGLQGGGQGLGLVGPDQSTLITLTACAKTNQVSGQCIGGKMQSPTFWLGALGFLIMSYGLMNQVKGSMIYGLLFVTLISWFRGTSVTYFPYTPLGDSNYEYFKKIIDFRTIKSTAGAISFADFNKSEVWIAIVTLLYVDVLATTGTLYTMGDLAGFVDLDKRSFEGEYVAYMVDAGSTIVGSALGVSPVSTFVESSAGIKEGGRTGLTAMFIGFYFFLSLFFIPLLASVPPWAIGSSLVMVGVMMMKVAKDIDWENNTKEAVSAFITIILMPLTYSISNGIIGGIGMYVALSLCDNILDGLSWLMKMKRKMVKEHNQVSATAVPDHNAIEIL